MIPISPAMYHAMVAKLLPTKKKAAAKKPARKNNIKPSRKTVIAKKKTVFKQAPRKTVRKNPAPTSALKLRHHVKMETAPGTWKLVAGFVLSVDAIEYAQAFHKKYPNVSVKVES